MTFNDMIIKCRKYFLRAYNAIYYLMIEYTYLYTLLLNLHYLNMT